MRKIAQLLSTWAASLIRNNQAPANTDQAQLITAMVAMAAAYQLPLPSGPVNRPQEWYLISCNAGVEDVVGAINEVVLMNVGDALKLAQEIWLLRYRMVNEPYSRQAMMGVFAALAVSNFDIAPNYINIFTTQQVDSMRQVQLTLADLLSDLQTQMNVAAGSTPEPEQVSAGS